jgi:DNA-binding winged helix-turn-helix (wHTH) protein/TolB-like protein/Flp pilus assembly protein TadD
MSDPARIRVGDWIVTPVLNLLERGEQSIRVEPRAMDVLAYLARRPGQVVSVDELMAAVWQGVVVTDHSVYLAISQLRQTLDDSEAGKRYIETIRKRGYRLTVPVVPLETASESSVTPGGVARGAAQDTPASAGGPRPTYRRLVVAAWLGGALAIALGAGAAALVGLRDRAGSGTEMPAGSPIVAVLPCENLSPDPDDAFFAAGIHDEIVQRLQQLSGLRPIARNAIVQYAERRPSTRQIAAELNAAAVMECTVRYAGENVLVIATLIDPDTDTPLWSQAYDGDRSDVSELFAMQADIAVNIAKALNAELLPAEQRRINRPRTDSMEAYQHFLQLLEEYRRYRPPQELFGHVNRAIEADPDFAFAHVARGVLHMGAANSNAILRATAADADPELLDAERQLELAHEAVGRALELDPDLGFAYTIQGTISLSTGDIDAARQSFERALKLSPGDPFTLRNSALFQLTQNRFREAIDLMERTRQLDPNAAEPMAYAIAGQSDVAREIARHDQNSLSPSPHLTLGLLEATIFDNPETAEAELRLAEQLAKDNQVFFHVTTNLLLVYAYGRLGLEADARRVYDEVLAALPDDGALTPMARLRAHLAFGEFDEAYEWALEMAENPPPPTSRDLLIFSLNTFEDPVLERPDFVELRQRLGYRE